MAFTGPIISFAKELHRRNPIFFYTGLLMSGLFVVFLASIGYCEHSLSDICHWLKPCKFALSFALYAFSLGWYLEYLKGPLSSRTIKWISGVIAFFLALEVVLMLLESGLSTEIYQRLSPSPETTHSLSRAIYYSSNTIILADSFIVMFITFQFFRPIRLEPSSYLWSIRAAFSIFLLSGFLGGYMIDHYGQVPEDLTRFGLPFTNLTTPKNYLISMHFLGIHYLQLIPLCCYYFQRYLGKKFVLSTVGLYIAGCLYSVWLSNP